MAKLTKKQKALQGKIVAQKPYPVQEALALAKETATAKFDESIDVAVNLGVDARKSDQVVRGSVVLPAGTGKSVRVAVFAQGEKAEAAKAAGAEVVGFDDLAADIKAGKMDFDIVIATPDAMRIVGQLGLGDIFSLGTGNFANLVGVRLGRAGLDTGCLLDQDGCRRGLHHESEGLVGERGDHNRNRQTRLNTLSLRIECLAELHDVQTALTQGRTNRG